MGWSLSCVIITTIDSLVLCRVDNIYERIISNRTSVVDQLVVLLILLLCHVIAYSSRRDQITVYIYIYIYMYVCMYVHIHIYIYICVYKYIYYNYVLCVMMLRPLQSRFG